MDTDFAAPLERMLRMVDDDVASSVRETGIARLSPRVRAALAAVPRHLFVPAEVKHQAYDNRPLPIGHDQTISQPFIVALMTELLEVQPQHVVLEVGTGSGYQAAVLSQLARWVVSVEIVPELSRSAAARLDALGVRNVELQLGDGHGGWPAAAPYDRIVVTASPRKLPMALVDQLDEGGRMVTPLGAPTEAQELFVAERPRDGPLRIRRALAVRFVPMTGGV